MAPFLLLISAGFSILGLSGLYRGIQLFKRGVRVEGKVVELIEEKSIDDSTFYPIVEFPFQDRLIKMKLAMGRNKGAYSIGDSITLVHPENFPEQAVELGVSVLIFPILILGASTYGIYYSISEM